jgi:hypothetical protein
VREIFDELRGLKVEKNPNASAVMFRILLELSVGNYLDNTKKIQPILDAAKKQNKGAEWYPRLRQMLDLLMKDPDFTPPTLAR